MKFIIAGSRDVIHASQAVAMAMRDQPFPLPTVVISGDARGIDKAGEQWAKMMGIPVEIYPADWDTHGKSAGYKRNQLMAGKADALVAIWDGKSRGTKHMIDIMEKAGKPVYVEHV